MLCYVFEKDYLRDRATQWTFITFSLNVAFMAVWFWIEITGGFSGEIHEKHDRASRQTPALSESQAIFF